jgi:hypothetical protein
MRVRACVCMGEEGEEGGLWVMDGVARVHV